MDTSEGAMPRDWEEAPAESPLWALRPWLLALLGLATGLAAHLILRDMQAYRPDALQLAAVTLVTVTAALTGFTIERRRWWMSLLFAAAAGAIAALVVWWNGPFGGWSAAEGWRVVSLFLAIAIAAPLFQAARDSQALRFPYVAVHDHAWTNVVLWCACWAFVGIAFLLVLLLGALFALIKIDFVRELLARDWFWRSLTGLAFGGALGVLREQDSVVRLLQRVVATVLAVLAPVLGIGLLLFLVALPFTGLQALWDATSATTPILLSCMIGALILANAVIGDTPEHESRFPPLRFGAMALALVTLPLAVLAAIATGLRIGQYGFTPERLWGVTFVTIACLYGLACWWSLARGRLEWAAVARRANLGLAFVVCLAALFLATPILSFNAISTRDQVARLEAGKVAPDRFDWRALAFDFGAPGRDALKKLQASSNAAIKAHASQVASARTRWDVAEPDRRVERRAKVRAALRVLPQGATLPDELLDAVAQDYRCETAGGCTVLALPGEAIKFPSDCFEDRSGKGRIAMRCDPQRYVLSGSGWSSADGRGTVLDDAQRAALAAAYAAGKVEIRTVPRRQAFVGDVPVGEPFE